MMLPLATLIVQGLVGAILIGAMIVYGVCQAYPLFHDDKELPKRRKLKVGIYLVILLLSDLIILMAASIKGVIS